MEDITAFTDCATRTIVLRVPYKLAVDFLKYIPRNEYRDKLLEKVKIASYRSGELTERLRDLDDNKWSCIAGMLGVEINEEFKIDTYKGTFHIDEYDGLVYTDKKGYHWRINEQLYKDLLSEHINIIKID